MHSSSLLTLIRLYLVAGGLVSDLHMNPEDLHGPYMFSLCSESSTYNVMYSRMCTMHLCDSHDGYSACTCVFLMCCPMTPAINMLHNVWSYI